MGTRFPTGMAKRYVTKRNDRDAPSPAGTDDLTELRIPPEPLKQGGAGGIFAVTQLQFLAGEIKQACFPSEP